VSIQARSCLSFGVGKIGLHFVFLLFFLLVFPLSIVADLERFCANAALSDVLLVVLSLTMYAKRRDVVRSVAAMSHCRAVQIEGLAY
jgi:hypothetical protein